MKDNEDIPLPLQVEADTYNVNLSDMIQKIKEAGTCPVCAMLVKPPTQLCSNGHIMCKACVSTLTQCPLCMESFSKTITVSSIRLVGLDNILSELPRACDNDVFGCKFVYTTKVMLSEHKYSCSKRIVWCRVVGCEWQGEYKSIRNHINDLHKALLLTNGSVVQIKYEPNLYIVHPLFFKKLLIWKRVKINAAQKVMYIMLESCSIYNEEIKPMLVYTVRGRKNNFKYTCSNYACKYDDFKVDEEDSNPMTTPHHMTIPLNVLDYVKDEQDTIMYIFKVKNLKHAPLNRFKFIWDKYMGLFIMILLCFVLYGGFFYGKLT